MSRRVQGTAVTVQWSGYHNIKEVSGPSCSSSEIQEIEGWLSSGNSRTYSNNELSAAPGQRRYFKCDQHCSANGARFEVYCPSATPTPSPNPTPSAPSATPTPSAPSANPTPSAPSPNPTPSPSTSSTPSASSSNSNPAPSEVLVSQSSSTSDTFSSLLDGKYFNAPSEDTSLVRYLFDKAQAEMECDLYVECEGIVQWNQLYEGTLYSLYTTRTIIEGHTLKDFSNFDFSFFQKMTNIYKGKLLEDSVCDVLVPGLSRYPTVEYIEEYNVPIQDADLTIVEDRETGAVEIGNGIWTKCWTYMPNLNTKVGCFEEAKKSNYGFAFSEVTNTCLIYTGITDASKIQLDKYTDETRLSQHDPCTRDASWFT